MTSSRPGWNRLATLAALTTASLLALGTPTAGATPRGASESTVAAKSALLAERALVHSQAAGSRLVSRKRNLARCLLRHPNGCQKLRTEVQHTERRLAIDLTRVSAAHEAPVVTVSGDMLTWAPVEGVEAYVVKSQVSGRPDKRTVVIGTSLTVEGAAGETVEYTVRAASSGGEWSQPVTVSFEAATPLPDEPGLGSESGSVPGGGSGSGSAS